MANVVKAKIMHEKSIPVILVQLLRKMPCHVVVNFSEVLGISNLVSRSTL